METRQLTHITACVNRNVISGKDLSGLLSECGIVQFNLISGRNAFLRERTGLLGSFLPGPAMISSLSDVISFLVDPKDEFTALHAISDKFQITIAGNGSVFSDAFSVIGGEDLYAANKPAAPSGDRPVFQSDIIGICCIVQRGEGDTLARAVLDSSIGSPVISYGTGTGLRDKVGLLRITIPAEKEILLVTTDSYSADQAFDMLVYTGRLDQPGKGFIYLWDIGDGLINPKVSESVPLHAANMEQIIFAVDEMKGSTQWRRKNIAQAGGAGNRKTLSGLEGLDVICNEGRADDLTAAAMAAGAAGATISKFRYVFPGEIGEGRPSPAREMCSMIIGEKQAGSIILALENAGLFDRNTLGQIRIKKVPKACTYLGKPG